MSVTVNVIGAGLAGCEAAWAVAEAGINVRLYEMKPQKYEYYSQIMQKNGNSASD